MITANLGTHAQIDISPSSYSMIHTPGIPAQRLPFFVHSFGHFQAGPAYYTERENLDNFLLIYTVSGAGQLRYRGGTYQLGPGQAFLIHCREYQFYRTGESGSWEIKWLHFNGPASSGYCELINEDRLQVVTLASPAEFEKMLDRIPLLLEQNDFKADNEIALDLTRIMSELVANRMQPDKRPFARYREIVSHLTVYLQDHYMEQLKMGELLETIPLSPYHFIRLFKQQTGFSPYGYLTNYRIHHSKRLLKETDLSVQEISFQVGFNDVNNYIREFKKLVGTTPATYRKLWM